MSNFKYVTEQTNGIGKNGLGNRNSILCDQESICSSMNNFSIIVTGDDKKNKNTCNPRSFLKKKESNLFKAIIGSLSKIKN
jgi:hypothetical protein